MKILLYSLSVFIIIITGLCGYFNSQIKKEVAKAREDEIRICESKIMEANNKVASQNITTIKYVRKIENSIGDININDGIKLVQQIQDFDIAD